MQIIGGNPQPTEIETLGQDSEFCVFTSSLPPVIHLHVSLKDLLSIILLFFMEG